MNSNVKYKMEEKLVIDCFGIGNYLKAKTITKDNIVLTRGSDDYYYEFYNYDIKDQNDIHSVYFSLYGNNIRNCKCTCEKFIKNDRCEHLAAVFIKHFNVEEETKDLSIDSYYENVVNNLTKKVNKQLINLEISFVFKENYAIVRFKVGDDKKYSTTSKLSNFFAAFNSKNKNIPLGKSFTYKPQEHKFSETDEQILSFLSSAYDQYGRVRGIELSVNQLKFLMGIMQDKPYSIENTKRKGVGYENGMPYDVSLKENSDKFNFKFDIKDKTFLTEDYTVAYENKKLYFIDDEFASLIASLTEDEVEEINLSKNSAVNLSKKISLALKDNYIIEEKLEEEFKVVIPKSKIYIDFKSNVEAKVIFDYNKKDINYFDDQAAYRNYEYEEKVISDLIEQNFFTKNKKFIIEDIDNIVDFIEKGIYKLKEKYDIFTSEKFNAANVIKKSGIKSQFSIGTDNIMTYKFDLDEINPKELNKIFDSMENNKKYFKLKSGQILNMDDKDLEDLKEVCETLNIDDYEESGIIPKYRALYLDSVKQYDIIQTNNIFDEFINNFNKYKSCDIYLNDKDKKILRDYQLTGVKWLYNIYKCGFGGILADEMGLGKTIQTIMFIKNVIKEKPDSKILIVAPTSLIYNWEHEFDMFGSELKYKVIANNKDKRIKDLEGNENIFITTYGLLRQDQEIYADKNFEIIIIDEAQNIKNPKAGISMALKGLNSNVKIALTGTPVENSVVEVWSIFDFLMPGYLNTLSKFQSKYNVKEIDEDGRKKLSTLTKLITPFILRRKKKDVLVDLPDKIENNIYLDLLPEQKKYYAAQVKKSKEEFEKLLSEEGFLKARFKILQLLTKLRQLCIDPKIVFDNYSDESVKMVEIINIINEYIENGHKILVFTSFKTALDILKEKLDENAITNYVIDGSVSSKQRNELVNAFNKDNTNVFLITLKSGGTGLNLTSADVVIHLDLWWNPQAENQATDRAHRIGQKNVVEVIKLICKGTIEEKIIELQDKKKILNDTLIENENVSDSMISKLSENDIKDLLKSSD